MGDLFEQRTGFEERLHLLGKSYGVVSVSADVVLDDLLDVLDGFLGCEAHIPISVTMSMPGSPVSPKSPTFSGFLYSENTPKPYSHSLRAGFRRSAGELSPVLLVGARSWAGTASGARLRRLLSTSSLPTADPDSDWNPFLGFIGTNKASKGPPESSYQHIDSYLASDERFQGQCFKVDKFNVQENSVQRALLYLKLRQDGCTKEKSIVFTKKRKCMFDSTQEHDGPACHRTIRLGNNRTSGPNWKGWQLHTPKFDVGRRFQPISSDLDQKEYEVIAREFERLVDRQQRQRLGVDFQDADENRAKYFEGLRREWRKRKANKRPKASPPKETPAPATVVIVEEKKEPKQQEEPFPKSKTLPLSFFPSLFSVASTSTRPEQTMSRPASPPKASEIAISKVHRYHSSSLIIRNVPPSQPETPKKIRIAERQNTHHVKKRSDTYLSNPETDKRRMTVLTYNDLLKKLKGRSNIETLKKEAKSMTGPQVAREELILGIAKLYLSSLGYKRTSTHHHTTIDRKSK